MDLEPYISVLNQEKKKKKKQYKAAKCSFSLFSPWFIFPFSEGQVLHLDSTPFGVGLGLMHMGLLLPSNSAHIILEFYNVNYLCSLTFPLGPNCQNVDWLCTILTKKFLTP